MNPAWFHNPAFWNDIPSAKRYRLMYSWLACCQMFTHAQIKKLLSPGFDSKAEQERQNKLAQIFGLKWGESPFLSNSPATQKILKSRFRYQQQKIRIEQSNKRRSTLLKASSYTNESSVAVVNERNASSPALQDHHFTTPAKKKHQSGSDKNVDQLIMSVESIHIAQKRTILDYTPVQVVARRRVSTSPDNARSITTATEDVEIETILLQDENQYNASISTTAEEERIETFLTAPLAKDQTSKVEKNHSDQISETYHNASCQGAVPPVRRRVSFFGQEDTHSIALSEVTNIGNRNSNHYSSDSSLKNLPCKRTVRNHLKNFTSSILYKGEDDTTQMRQLKVALDFFSNKSLEGIKIFNMLETEKNEKGPDWMQRYFVPELQKLIPWTEEEKEKVIFESFGIKALNLLHMMIQSSTTDIRHRGRKGDALQHSIDLVLTAILPPEKEALPEGITYKKMLGMTRVHHSTYNRARKKRADFNSFLMDKKKTDYEYDLCRKEFDQKMEELGRTAWKEQIRSVDMKVNAMLKKIQEIYGMTTLLTEHLSLQYIAFQRIRWKSFNLTSIANGNETVLRRIKIENGSLRDLTIDDFELNVICKTSVVKMENPLASGIRHQEKRIDNIDHLIAFRIYEFCHCQEYVRVDSNSNSRYKVTLPDGSKDVHVRQHWANPGNDSAQLKRFVESKYYDKLWDDAIVHHPKGFSDSKPRVGLQKFIDMKCSCVKDKDHAACVDIFQDNLENDIDCLTEWINNKSNFRRSSSYFDNLFCDCNICEHNPRNEDEQNWYNIFKLNGDHHFDHISKLCDIALCPCQEEVDLKVTSEERPFKIRPLACSNGECEDCSIEANLPFDCEAMIHCSDIVQCYTWTQLDSNTNNRVPVKTDMSVSTVFRNLKIHLEDYVKHNFHLRWQKRAMKLDIDSFRETLLIFTDYASGINMTPPKSECCAHDPHGVLAVFVVLHGRELARLHNGEDVDFTYCDHWFCTVGTETEGKMSDWITHGQALDQICHHYIVVKKKKFDTLRCWTDNCPPQYKNRQNMFQLALLMMKYEFKRVEHLFGSIYGFKGVWDALGKVVKSIVLAWQKQYNQYVFSSYGYYIVLRNAFALTLPKNKDWMKLKSEGSFKLEEKSEMMAISRFMIYATDRKVEYDEIKQSPKITFLDSDSEEANSDEVREAVKNDRIVFLDRDTKLKNQDTAPIPGTNENFHFRILKDRVFKAPNDLSNEDHLAIIEYFSNRDGFELNKNTPEKMIDALDCIEAEWNNTHDRGDSVDQQVTCKHCQCIFPSSIIAIHEVFCIENDLNLTFPIQYRKRPCFCLDCQNGDECDFGYITGTFRTHDMLRKSQSMKRKGLERVAKLVKATKMKSNVTTVAVVKLMNLLYPDFPVSIPSITGEAQEDLASVESLSKSMKAGEIKLVATNFLGLEVTGTGTSGGILKRDCTKAIDLAGGWKAIIDKWTSTRVQGN